MATDTPQVTGAAALSQRIAKLRENLNLPALTQEIGVLLQRRTIQRFDKEVDPDNRRWKPLSPATLRIKRRLGYGRKGMLKRTERLRNSIRVIRGGFGSTFTNTGAGVRIGVDDPKVAEYARVQNRGEGRIPARRFLGIGSLDVKAVDSLLRRKAKQLERGL